MAIAQSKDILCNTLEKYCQIIWQLHHVNLQLHIPAVRLPIHHVLFIL